MKFAEIILAIALLSPVIGHTATIDEHLREAVGSVAPRKYLEIQGIRLAVHDSDPRADKPAILCLHAVGHGGSDFAFFETAVSDRYRIITVDWPGQGYSSQDSVPTSASRYAELIADIAAQMKLRNFVIVGNSIGGAAAIRFAAKHPNQIEALILSNPGGLDDGGPFAKIYIRWLEQKFKAGIRGKSSFQKWFKNYYDHILVTKQAEAQKTAIVRSGYEIAPRLAEAWGSFRTSKEDLRPLIPKIETPVLFAWASLDRYVRLDRNIKAIEQFKNKKLVQFPAGHAPFLETPEAFNTEVLNFLSEIGYR